MLTLVSMVLHSQALSAICFSGTRPHRFNPGLLYHTKTDKLCCRTQVFQLKCSSQPLTDDELAEKERKIGGLLESAREAIYSAINSDDNGRKERVQVAVPLPSIVVLRTNLYLFPQKAKEISQSCKKEFEEVLTRLRSDPDTKRYTEVDQAIGYLVRRIDGQLEHMCAKCGEPR